MYLRLAKLKHLTCVSEGNTKPSGSEDCYFKVFYKIVLILSLGDEAGGCFFSVFFGENYVRQGGDL